MGRRARARPCDGRGEGATEPDEVDLGSTDGKQRGVELRDGALELELRLAAQLEHGAAARGRWETGDMLRPTRLWEGTRVTGGGFH